MIVDSHCHLDCLDLDKYDGVLQSALDAAAANGVEHFLCVCIDLDNFPKVLSIAEQYPNIHASVGLHPNHKDDPSPSVEQLLELSQHPKIVAIGETGLDYYYHKEDNEWQRTRFRYHIQAAKQCDKPLIIHTRDAREDTIAIMKEEGAEAGVMHCFTETWDMAKAALDLNFYISFSGIVTFKNAQALKEVAKKVPLDRILIETDSPYLAPVPFRGKPNEPAYVKHVADYLAELRGESFDKIAEVTTANFYRLFGIEPAS